MQFLRIFVVLGFIAQFANTSPGCGGNNYAAPQISSKGICNSDDSIQHILKRATPFTTRRTSTLRSSTRAGLPSSTKRSSTSRRSSTTSKLTSTRRTSTLKVSTSTRPSSRSTTSSRRSISTTRRTSTSRPSSTSSRRSTSPARPVSTSRPSSTTRAVSSTRRASSTSPTRRVSTATSTSPRQESTRSTTSRTTTKQSSTTVRTSSSTTKSSTTSLPSTCTDLAVNGTFKSTIDPWTSSGSAAIFWVANSIERPAHSGNGQAYIFLASNSDVVLSQTIPAIHFGHAINITFWLRGDASYPTDSDDSENSCQVSITDPKSGTEFLEITRTWKAFTYNTIETGRSEEIELRASCNEAEDSVSLLVDDASFLTCTSGKGTDPCLIPDNSTNSVFNPGSECLGGLDAYEPEPINESEKIVQGNVTSGNQPHSGQIFGTIVFDDTSDPPDFSGITISQHFTLDPGTVYKLTFWLKADALYYNTAGCILDVFSAETEEEYDLSELSEKTWTKYSISGIQGDSSDGFSMFFTGCTSSRHPKIFIDDIFYGIESIVTPIDLTSTTTPSASTTIGPTPTCTTIPKISDSDFESSADYWEIYPQSPTSRSSPFPPATLPIRDQASEYSICLTPKTVFPSYNPYPECALITSTPLQSGSTFPLLIILACVSSVLRLGEIPPI